MEFLKHILTSLTRTNSEHHQVLIEEQRQLVRPSEIMKHYQTYLLELPAIYLPVRSVSQPFKLREGHYDDIYKYINLEKRGYAGLQAWDLNDFIRDYRTNPYRVYLLLAWEDPQTGKEEIAGLISGRFLAKKAHISHLIVDPKYQGKGVGTGLLEIWIDLMEKQGIPYCELEVRVSNETAIRLYESVNFRKKVKMSNYYRDNHEDAWKMRRVNNADEF